MIVVTGANGFVGAALVRRLVVGGRHRVVAAARDPASVKVAGLTAVTAPDLSADADWTQALTGARVVIHLAARVHMLRDTAQQPLVEYRSTNVAGSIRLARQAAALGVRRFVFVSSIKVNGDITEPGRSFNATDSPAPRDPYGISKLEAEDGLRRVAAETGIELVIVRPPLIYGPGVKANFRALMRWLASGMPLPLGAIHNRRSLVFLDNLVSLLVACVEHPAAAGQVLLASDGEDLSTTDLLRRLALAMGKPARLLPIPQRWLERGAAWLGKPDVAQRLCGSLCVDIGRTRELLDWSPPTSVAEGLRITGEAFLREARL